MQASNPFSEDGTRARAFAVLRRRVERVPQAFEYYHRVLGGIFSEFYLLRSVPSSFEVLCRVLSQPAELRRVVDHQIHAGARCALALVHSHWPGVNIALAAGGPPDGRNQPMDEHYDAADEPARQVVRRVCEENDRYLGSLCKVKMKPGD